MGGLGANPVGVTVAVLKPAGSGWLGEEHITKAHGVKKVALMSNMAPVGKLALNAASPDESVTMPVPMRWNKPPIGL